MYTKKLILYVASVALLVAPVLAVLAMRRGPPLITSASVPPDRLTSAAANSHVPSSAEAEVERRFNQVQSRAEKELAARNYSAAESDFRSVLKNYRVDESMKLGLASAIEGQGKHQQAVAIYEDALESSPGVWRPSAVGAAPLTELGDLATKLGNSSLATRAYRRVLEVGYHRLGEEMELFASKLPSEEGQLAAWAHVQVALTRGFGVDRRPDIELAFRLAPHDSIVELAYAQVLRSDGDQTAQRILMARAEKDSPTEGLRIHIHHQREMSGYLWKSHHYTINPKDGSRKDVPEPYPDNEPLIIMPHTPNPQTFKTPIP